MQTIANTCCSMQLRFIQ